MEWLNCKKKIIQSKKDIGLSSRQCWMVLDSSWLWQTAVGFKVMKYSQNLALINDQWSYPIENHAKASLNQGLRKCQAQLSTKTYTWFFRSILVFMRQVGKFSLLRFSLKSFKSKFWWQFDAIRTIADVRLIISENICCCRRVDNCKTPAETFCPEDRKGLTRSIGDEP